MDAIKSPVFAPPNGSKPAVYHKSKGYLGKLNTLVEKINFRFYWIERCIIDAPS